MTRFAPVSAAFLATALALTLPSAARADEASQRAKAAQLIDMQHIDQGVRQNADGITKQVDDAADRAAGPDATDEQKAKIADFKKQAGQLIDSKLGWEPMKPAIVDIYVKNFTEEQLDQILAFYKTPAGAALLEKMPTVNSQFGQVGNARVADLRAQLQQSFKDLQQSLHPIPTLGPPSSPAPSSSPAAK